MRIRPLYAGVGLVAGLGLLAAACGGTASTTPVHSQAMPAAHTTASPLVKTAKLNVSGRSETILTDGRGRTLYSFAPEKDGKIVTTADTLQKWPILAAAAGGVPTSSPALSGKLGVVMRPDGIRQVTYNEFPLYTFAGDRAPGDTAGDGVGGQWHVVQSVMPPDADNDGDGTQSTAQQPATAAPSRPPAGMTQPAATPQMPAAATPAPAAAPAARPMAPMFNDGDADNSGGTGDADGNG